MQKNFHSPAAYVQPQQNKGTASDTTQTTPLHRAPSSPTKDITRNFMSVTSPLAPIYVIAKYRDKTIYRQSVDTMLDSIEAKISKNTQNN
jgi:hypothetical protein